MSHTHLSNAKSRRDLAGSRHNARARLRHRHLQTERLEDRRLLAFADFDRSSQIPSNVTGLEDNNNLSTIFGQGEQRAVNPGHWIVAMDGLPAGT